MVKDYSPIISIRLPATTIVKVDTVARKEKVSRTEIIKRAIASFLESIKSVRK